MEVVPRIRLPYGLPSEAKPGKPSNLTMAALLTIGLVFAWLSSQSHMTAGHLQASQAAVSLANNQGNIGKTLHDLGSSQNMRQLATAVVTAGALSGMGQVTFGEGPNAFRLNDVKVGDGLIPNIGKNLIDGVARATINSAITGTDLQTNIRTNVVASILGAAQAQGANWIGNQTLLGGDFNTNGNVNQFAHEFAHAIVGCAAGAAGAAGSGTGQGCGAGALGAVVGELSAKFYNSGDTTPKADTVAFAQMMSGIAAAAAGLGAEGVAIAANTGANAAQNNYMAHYDTYEADLKSCQQNPGGVNCGAILSLTEGANARYLGMTQGGYRVAANRGKDGADSSYTVVSPDGETMVMQPTEWAYFSQMTSGQQATIFSASQWQLDFNSMTEYSFSGDPTTAMANYGHMFTTPSYLEDAGLGLFSGIGLGEVASLLRAPVKVLGDVSKGVDWPELSGSLREASNAADAALARKGKINFGMGSFNNEQTMTMGEAWVGSGYRVTSKGYYESADGLRQFRPPSYKPGLSKTQANFEQRIIPSGKWGANGHVDVTQ